MARKTKYGNKRHGGFDSRAEAAYFERLKSDDSILTIERQVKYTLIPSQRGEDGKVVERPCAYIADFMVTYRDGRVDVIDVKGFRTPDYIIKRKLMLYVHGIRVIEVK